MNRLQELITFWQSKYSEIQNEMRLSAMKPEYAKKCADTLPIIQETIKSLRQLKILFELMEVQLQTDNDLDKKQE